MVALSVAAVICASCVATIPFWDHLGMGGGVYHVLRLFVIGLVLGCMPRTASLSFAFLLLLIGVSDAVIDARQLGIDWHVLADANLYRGLAIDATSMAAALGSLHVVRSIRRTKVSA
jgi:hypothetical protein